MKRIYWILTSISLYSLLSCSNGAKDTQEYQTVKTDTVISAGGQTSLQYPGKVKAAQDISLAFRVSGTIQKIYVKDGARVQAGQLLAELDPTDYQVQLDATEAEYKQIKAEAERVMALYKDNGTTPSANDKAVYGLKQITAKYRHHKDQLGYTRLYAPFNGYIQKRLFEAHETVGAGMPVLSMISNSAPEVEINLPAAEYIRREQRGGKLVAMMGDGTNDAPALAQADVGVAMNSGTQAAKEAGNMVDLDNDPTKLIEIVEIGKQLLMTRGTLTTFSIANDVAKYFAIVPALFIASIPSLQALNIMHLHSPESAILSAIIFNAVIIPLLIPLALRGVAYKPIGASALLRRNLFIYGLGGLIAPFIGIKLIDMIVSVFF